MKITLDTTPDYPGVSLLCPKSPATGKTENFYFASGVPVVVDDETARAISQQHRAMPDYMRSRIRLYVEQDVPVDVKVEAIAPAVETVEELVALTDDDEDLVSIEVSKLLGKTIAEAKPMMTGTATNAALPLLMRKVYLGRILQHPQIQKGLKDIAEEMLAEISS